MNLDRLVSAAPFIPRPFIQQHCAARGSSAWLMVVLVTGHSDLMFQSGDRDVVELDWEVDCPLESLKCGVLLTLAKSEDGFIEQEVRGGVHL